MLMFLINLFCSWAGSSFLLWLYISLAMCILYSWLTGKMLRFLYNGPGEVLYAVPVIARIAIFRSTSIFLKFDFLAAPQSNIPYFIYGIK